MRVRRPASQVVTPKSDPTGSIAISISQKLGVASIPVIASLAVAFGLFDMVDGVVFQSALIQIVINVFVILTVSLIVVRISAKSFLTTGSSNLLLLGLAVFEFGFSSTVGGFITGLNVDEGIEMYVLGALVSAFLHLSSGILTYKGSPVRRTRLKLRLGFSYVSTTIFVLLIGFFVLNSSFLSSIGQFGSIVQRSVIATIVVTLLASSFFFSRVYSRTRSPVLYWYSLAVATVSFAYFAFFTTQENGDLATWTGIFGLCLSSVYFLKSVLSAPKAISTGPGIGATR